ncbi:MAG: hypothetical protein ABI564_10345 [Ideonella sp.]
MAIPGVNRVLIGPLSGALRHRLPAVPALLKRAVYDFLTAWTGPQLRGRMSERLQHHAGALQIVIVVNPQFWQGLIGWQFACNAACKNPLDGGRYASLAQPVGPQGGQRKIRGDDQSTHSTFSEKLRFDTVA